MRVLWVVVDSLGAEMVTDELMPNLVRLGGPEAPVVVDGVLPASTYPNHATFVTGTGPREHGIYANEVLVNREWVGAGRAGPAVPTIFERLDATGCDSAAVFGDPELVGVCGAEAATAHWPGTGVLRAGVELGPLGCSADSATIGAARDLAIQEASFAMVQLDENDAVNHVEGPGSGAARAQATRSDEALAGLLDLYGAHWGDTVVMVMSDHRCEPVGDAASFDLGSVLTATLTAVDPEARWICDGTAGVIAPGHRSGVREAVAALGCVAGVSGGPADGLCVWGGDGVLFGPDWGQRGDHGSIRCRPQVAAIGGGHSVTATLQADLAGTVRASRDWFGLTMELLAA